MQNDFKRMTRIFILVSIPIELDPFIYSFHFCSTMCTNKENSKYDLFEILFTVTRQNNKSTVQLLNKIWLQFYTLSYFHFCIMKFHDIIHSRYRVICNLDYY